MSKLLMTFALFAAIFLMAVSFTNAQSTPKKSDQKKSVQKSAERKDTRSVDEEAQIRKSVLLSELSALNIDAGGLDSPLARAVVKTEIANVAWNLDKQWARQLLKDAFELALPDKETRRKLHKVKKGDNPLEPTKETIPQMMVRNKVLAVARRDPAFADELAKIAKEEMGEYEEVRAYASSSYAAFQADDKKQTMEYARKIFDAADPSQVNAGGSIDQVARFDRDEADKLILEYIQKLRSFPINSNNALRIFSGLRTAVFSLPLSIYQGKKAPVAGKEAMRAYCSFLIESLLDLELREPGAARRLDIFILHIWPFVLQQAPELVDSYRNLEAISGLPKQSDSLQTSSPEEINKARVKTAVRDAQTNQSQNDIVEAIKMALGRADYETSRDLIDKLPEDDLRSTYTEDVNRREAISLLGKKDFDGAARIAGKLESVASLTQVYPQLIKFCVDEEDMQRVNSLAGELTRKLEKKSEPSKAALILSRVAGAVAAKDEVIAMELLKRAISAANASDIKRAEANSHIVEFDNKVFELLALSSEAQMFEMAKGLDGRLYRSLAFAAIYRGKSNALLKETKTGGN